MPQPFSVERQAVGVDVGLELAVQRHVAAVKLFHDRFEPALPADPLEARPVGHVVEDAHGERRGLLEDHADPASEPDQVHDLAAERGKRRHAA